MQRKISIFYLINVSKKSYPDNSRWRKHGTISKKSTKGRCGSVYCADNEIGKAIKAIRNADTMIVVGTSLTVYPAAGFVRHFRGNNLVLLNKSQTQYDSVADVVIHEDIVDIIKKIKE